MMYKYIRNQTFKTSYNEKTNYSTRYFSLFPFIGSAQIQSLTWDTLFGGIRNDCFTAIKKILLMEVSIFWIHKITVHY